MEMDTRRPIQSAYRIQFMGRRKKPSLTPIWKTKAELKCRIFARILLQHKILTANNLAKRGWTHDPNCKLCNTALETSTHLCYECPFTQIVCTKLTLELGRQDLSFSPSETMSRWWRRRKRSFDRKQKPRFDGLVFYLWCNIWKERNRRIFQQKSLDDHELAQMVLNDTKLYQEARKERRSEPSTHTQH
jgi:hypothetical protein